MKTISENPMLQANSYVGLLISIIEAGSLIRTAYKVISPKLVVRVSRRTKFYKRNRRNEFVVTVGEPNYKTVKFIKDCKAAKEPFPVMRVQIELYLKKKARK